MSNFTCLSGIWFVIISNHELLEEIYSARSKVLNLLPELSVGYCICNHMILKLLMNLVKVILQTHYQDIPVNFSDPV